jgi:parvulin-like peptidyl-prolyl isomerase
MALMATGAGCRAAPPRDPVLLSLGRQEVRRSDFDRHVQSLEARGGAPLAPAVRTALLQPFLEERVVVLEARNRGLLSEGSTPEQEQSAVGDLLAQVVGQGGPIGEGEIAGYYDQHRDEFQAPESVALRQILVATRTDAEDVRQRLLKHPDEFEALARSRSRGIEASQGGLMGRFSRGQLPSELEQPAFAVPAGAVSDIVQTALGYHIIRVEARTPSRQRPLEECRDEIRGLLSRRKTDEGVRQFVQGLLARAKVNHEAAQAAVHPS